MKIKHRILKIRDKFNFVTYRPQWKFIWWHNYHFYASDIDSTFIEEFDSLVEAKKYLDKEIVREEVVWTDWDD